MTAIQEMFFSMEKTMLRDTPLFPVEAFLEKEVQAASKNIHREFV